MDQLDQTTVPASPPTQLLYCTYILMVVNILVYAFMYEAGGPTLENLVSFGAKENGLIADGEIVRLFLPIFLHGGLLHIFMNMVALYQLGSLLENSAGPKALFWVYIFSGIVGNLCSFAFSPNISVGASSSICGILTCLFVLAKYEESIAEELKIPFRAPRYGIDILLVAFMSVVVPVVDWASHLGGAIGGAFLGMGLVMRYRWDYRFYKTTRYVGHLSALPKPVLIEREGFYYSILAVISLAFAAGSLRIDFGDKAFGRGLQSAGKNTVPFRHLDYTSHFKTEILSVNAPTNQALLLSGAITLHNNGHYLAAIRVYEVLEEMHKNLSGYLDSSGFYRALMLRDLGSKRVLQAKELASKGIALSADFMSAFERPEDVQSPEGPEIPEGFAGVGKFEKRFRENPQSSESFCSEAAMHLKMYGYFGIAAKLFDCAYQLHPGNMEFAMSAVQCYVLSGNIDEAIKFKQFVKDPQLQLNKKQEPVFKPEFKERDPI